MKRLFKNPMLLLLLLAGINAAAQKDTSFTLLKTVRIDIADVAVDYLDNLYILTTTDQLKKLNAHGDSVGVYNQVKKFGKLSSIDVTNPLKLLLFYKDFSTIAVLDRLLTLRTAIDLRKYNILQASAIGLSYDSNIWLFDAYENKLKKINEEGSLLLQTPDFRSLFATPVVPQQIIDQDGLLYLYDAKSGVYIFDYYGTFKKKIPVTGWKSIAVFKQYITGITDNTFNYFNTSNFLSGQKALPLMQWQQYNTRLANNKLFSWSKDSLQVYNYPL